MLSFELVFGWKWQLIQLHWLHFQVYIQFSNAFGQVVDSYLASASADKLTKMTQRQLGGLKSDVDLNVKGENVVVLYHSGQSLSTSSLLHFV